MLSRAAKRYSKKNTKQNTQHRHNNVAAYVHWKICKEYKVHTVVKWYRHEPKTVREKNDTTTLYDNVMPIHTDR